MNPEARFTKIIHHGNTVCRIEHYTGLFGKEKFIASIEMEGGDTAIIDSHDLHLLELHMEGIIDAMNDSRKLLAKWPAP